MDANKKALAKNTLIILIGKLCTQFISFFLVPIYTRFLLTEEYGSIDLIISYISLFTPVLSLQLETAVFRFLVENRENEKNKNKIISTAVVFVSGIMMLAYALFMLLSHFYKIKYSGYMFACLLSSLLASLFLQIARGKGKMVEYSIACVISGASTVILNILMVVVLRKGVQGVLLSMTISYILSSIFLYVFTGIYKNLNIKSFDKKVLKEMLGFSLPLIPTNISWWVVNVSDRTIISAVLGMAENGIYAVSNKFSNLFNGFSNIVYTSWTESVSVNINKKESEKFLSDTSNLILKFFCFLCLGITMILSVSFNLIIGTDYLEAYNYVPVLLYAMLFNVYCTILSAFYIALKRTKPQMWTTLLGAVINVLINVLLIKHIGLWAASISTLVSYMLIALYRHADLKKYFDLKLDFSFLAKFALLTMVCLSAYYCKNLLFNFVSIVMVIGAAFYTFRKEFESIGKILKNRFSN